MLDRDTELDLLRETADLAGLGKHRAVLPTRKALTIDGRILHYLDWGNRRMPPMVFLHGGGLNAHTWDLVCLALRDQYWCLAVDLRGHGESSWSVDGDYRLSSYAADLRFFARRLLQTPFSLVGMSLGGLVAIQYASASPESVTALILVDVGPEPRSRGAQRINAFATATAEPSTLDELVDQSLRFNPRRRREVLRRSLVRNLRQTDDGLWVWKYDPRSDSVPWNAERLWHALGKIQCPTLVVRGDESDVFNDQDAEAVTSALPNGFWVRIRGAGHTVQGDQPAQLVAEVEAFLARNPGR